MGIVDEDVAQVRDATDFVALAGEHIALRKVGSRWVGLCPFHDEKSPSFSVNGELGLYFCFGCGAKGDAITFLREIEHLDFVEAVERLASRSGITLRYDDQATGRDNQRRAHIHETLNQAIAWYHQRLLDGSDASAARGYLRRERGYDGEVVRRYRLGWAPEGWDRLVKSLGVPKGALVDAGLATVDESGRYTDFFRGRILFPIYEANGQPVGAGGRQLPGGRPPKYKNTAGTAVYDKSRILYGLNWAKKAVVDTGQVVVCEGYTDVIGLHSAGVEEAVATCGTALADGHIRLLTRFARRIVLAYDADAAGQAAADRFYDWEKRYEVEIRVAAIPAGSDPGDLARSDPAALAAAVRDARPYLGFQIERFLARADLSNPEGRARAATGALELIAGHPNPLVRDQYLMNVAERCRIEPNQLRQMVAEGLPRRDQPAVETSRSDNGQRPEPMTVSGPELEALGLAVHQPQDMAGRLHAVLFDHPIARSAYEALAGADTLHSAIAGADPQTADLLQRLAVADDFDEPGPVMIRLVERAGLRAVRDMEAERRQAPPEQQAEFQPTTVWLKLTLEALRNEDTPDRTTAMEAEQRLVDWIVARDDAGGHPEATE